MHIILDANIYAADFRMESVAFRSLFDYLRKTADSLVLPRLVREEVIGHYLRELRARDQKVEKPWNQYRQVVLTNDLPRHVLTEPKYEVRKLRALLKKPAPHVATLYYPSFASVNVDEVVLRGIKRVRPASANGEELRDVILWFIVLGYARESQKDVAFITSDSGFWEGDNPHNQIVADIKEWAVHVDLYRTIDEFLRANAPRPQEMSAEWAAEKIPEASFATELLAAAKGSVSRHLPWATAGVGYQLRSLSFLKATFIEGTRYEVGDEIQYGEAAYTINLTAHVEAKPSSAVQSTGIGIGTGLGGFLSGMGPFSQSLMRGPLSTENPFAGTGFHAPEEKQLEVQRKDLEVRCTVRMSARIAKGQLPEVQINKVTIDSIGPAKVAKAVEEID